MTAFQAGCAEIRDEEVFAARESDGIYSGIPQDGIVLGYPSAPITMIEFTDFNCSHCRDYALRVLPAIVDRHVRTRQVKLVFRSLTFLGPTSVKTARMAAAVGQQNHLFEFVDVFFRFQERERPAALSDDVLRRLAAAVPGVDAETAMRRRDSPAVEQQLAAARREANQLEIRGVPAILIHRTGEEPRRVRLTSMSVEPITRAIESLLAAPPPAP